tara:strand:+ start:333 stop:1853 length:1521 start_codon:yes stop_codon:yes gene_type:complete
MSQPLQSINLVAPAFKGINTEDSPITQDPSFAEVADQAVIDQRGRISSRKGIASLTSDKTELGSDYIHRVHVFYDTQGNEITFSCGNNKIFTGTTVLVDVTPAGYVITGNNWKMINFNNACYFFQRDYEPLIYTNALGVLTPVTSVVGHSITSAQYGNEALGAYGRLWVVDTSINKNTIYWSDLLDGIDFSGGSSGSINIEKAWPDGFDEIKAISAHNNYLIIFGQHSIVTYGGADSPANMAIADTIAGVGCICRNSVQNIGTDILFMSTAGLRSFSRAIQEKSMPLSDLSRNVKTEIVYLVQNRTSPTASVYSPENSFYLIAFPDEQITYCFDLRGRLDNGSYRATRWPVSLFKSYHHKKDGTLIVGTVNGIGKYEGYSDEGESYRFKYYSPGLTFGDSSKLKMLKKLRLTLIGGNSENAFAYWSYDFETAFSSAIVSLGTQVPSLYGIGEFGVSEYTSGVQVSRPVINTTGDGTVITIGLEAQINGSEISLQEINVLALMGRTL